MSEACHRRGTPTRETQPTIGRAAANGAGQALTGLAGRPMIASRYERARAERTDSEPVGWTPPRRIRRPLRLDGTHGPGEPGDDPLTGAASVPAANGLPGVAVMGLVGYGRGIRLNAG
jgi:hypothetical protein